MKKSFVVLLVFFSLSLILLHAHVNGDNDTIWTTKFMTEGYPIIAYCFDAKFSPYGNSILAGLGYNIFEFDLMTGELIRKFDSCCPASENPDNQLRDIDFSQDNLFIVTGNGTPHIWDYQTGKQLKIIHQCGISPKFLGDNNKLIMGCKTKIMEYDWQSDRIINETEIEPNISIYGGISLSHNKSLMTVAYQKEEHDPNKPGYVWKTYLCLYDTEKLSHIKTFGIVNGRDQENLTAIISRNNKYVGFNVNDVAYIYDFNTGNLINTFPAYSFNFIENEDLIIYGTYENDIFKTKIQNIFSKQEVYEYNYKSLWSVNLNIKDQLLLSSQTSLVLLNSDWKQVDVKEEPVNDVLDSVWYSKAIINLRSNYPHEVQFNIINNIGQNVFHGIAQPIGSTQQFPIQLTDGVYFFTYEIAGSQYARKFFVMD